MYELAENSIESWASECKQLFGSQYTPMEEELCYSMARLILGEDEIDKDKNLRDDLEKKRLGLSSLFYLRVQYLHSYEVSLAIPLLVGLIAESPGEAVVYANYLQYEAFNRNKRRLGMQDICFIFPMGFPSKAALRKAWDLQKVERRNQYDSDNLLDYPGCMKSITICQEVEH
jgi:hypothetical protein